MQAPVTHEREPRQPLFVSPCRKPMDGAQDGTAGLTDDDGDPCRSLAGDPARWGARARAALVSRYTASDPGAAGNR